MKLKLMLLLFSLINFFNAAYCQNIQVTLAAGIDTTNNLNKKEIFFLWSNYLNSSPDSLYDNPYWNKVEKEKYISFDLINNSGFLSPSLYGLAYRGGKNVVLSIAPYGDFYIINSLFYFPYPDKSIYPLSITNHIARKENNEYKLFNYLPEYTKNWQYKNVGLFKYIYHPAHPFDVKKADDANLFYNKLIKTFEVAADTITYYIAENCDKIHELQGFDYVVGKGSDNNLCGFIDSKNKIIYSNTINGEDFRHEIGHTILERFPNSGVFHLGIVTYWGWENSHFNKSLNYHIKRINIYLKEHPEIDLNNFLETFYYMDEFTSPNYIFAAIFCHEAIQKGGINKLKKLFNYGNSNEATYIAIEKEFGIKRKDLNNFIRKKFEYYSVHGINPIEL